MPALLWQAATHRRRRAGVQGSKHFCALVVSLCLLWSTEAREERFPTWRTPDSHIRSILDAGGSETPSLVSVGDAEQLLAALQQGSAAILVSPELRGLGDSVAWRQLSTPILLSSPTQFIAASRYTDAGVPPTGWPPSASDTATKVRSAAYALAASVAAARVSPQQPYQPLDFGYLSRKLRITNGTWLALIGFELRGWLPASGYTPMVVAASPGAAVLTADCLLVRNVGVSLEATLQEALAMPQTYGGPPANISTVPGPYCSPAPLTGSGVCYSQGALRYSQFAAQAPASLVLDPLNPAALNGSGSGGVSSGSGGDGGTGSMNVILSDSLYVVEHDVDESCVTAFGVEHCIYQLAAQIEAQKGLSDTGSAATTATVPPTAASSSADSGSGCDGPTTVDVRTAAGAAVGATLGVCVLVALLAWFIRRVRLRHRTFTMAVRPPGATPQTTLLVTDIMNSTNLWEQLPTEVMNEALRLHHKCLRSLLPKCNGYESATEGDSFILAFHSAFDAAKFCILVQQALLEVAWPLELLDHQDGHEVWVQRARPKLSALAALTPHAGGRTPRIGTKASLGLGLGSLLALRQDLGGVDEDEVDESHNHSFFGSGLSAQGLGLIKGRQPWSIDAWNSAAPANSPVGRPAGRPSLQLPSTSQRHALTVRGSGSGLTHLVPGRTPHGGLAAVQGAEHQSTPLAHSTAGAMVDRARSGSSRPHHTWTGMSANDTSALAAMSAGGGQAGNLTGGGGASRAPLSRSTDLGALAVANGSWGGDAKGGKVGETGSGSMWSRMPGMFRSSVVMPAAAPGAGSAGSGSGTSTPHFLPLPPPTTGDAPALQPPDHGAGGGGAGQPSPSVGDKHSTHASTRVSLDYWHAALPAIAAIPALCEPQEGKASADAEGCSAAAVAAMELSTGGGAGDMRVHRRSKSGPVGEGVELQHRNPLAVMPDSAAISMQAPAPTFLQPSLSNSRVSRFAQEQYGSPPGSNPSLQRQSSNGMPPVRPTPFAHARAAAQRPSAASSDSPATGGVAYGEGSELDGETAPGAASQCYGWRPGSSSNPRHAAGPQLCSAYSSTEGNAVMAHGNNGPSDGGQGQSAPTPMPQLSALQSNLLAPFARRSTDAQLIAVGGADLEGMGFDSGEGYAAGVHGTAPSTSLGAAAMQRQASGGSAPAHHSEVGSSLVHNLARSRSGHEAGSAGAAALDTSLQRQQPPPPTGHSGRSLMRGLSGSSGRQMANAAADGPDHNAAAGADLIGLPYKPPTVPAQGTSAGPSAFSSGISHRAHLARARTQALEMIPLAAAIPEVRETWREMCRKQWPLCDAPQPFYLQQALQQRESVGDTPAQPSAASCSAAGPPLPRGTVEGRPSLDHFALAAVNAASHNSNRRHLNALLSGSAYATPIQAGGHDTGSEDDPLDPASAAEHRPANAPRMDAIDPINEVGSDISEDGSVTERSSLGSVPSACRDSQEPSGLPGRAAGSNIRAFAAVLHQTRAGAATSPNASSGRHGSIAMHAAPASGRGGRSSLDFSLLTAGFGGAAHNLHSPPAANTAVLMFRGLRVRMGMHTGVPSPTDIQFNHTTGHMAYSGLPLKVAKAVGDAAAGGMVLLTNHTYNVLQAQVSDLPGHPQLQYAGDAQVELHVRSLYVLMPKELSPRMGYMEPLRNLNMCQLGNLDAPVGDTAICFMTVPGASKAVAEHGSPAVAALRTFKALVTDLCCRHGGYVVEATDGLCLASFGEPAAAAIWVLACKEAIRSHAWPPEVLACHAFAEDKRYQKINRGRGLPSRRVAHVLARGPRIRAGIAMGQATVDVSSATGRLAYRGKVMNRAARIASKASDNQLLVSTDSWHRVVATLGLKMLHQRGLVPALGTAGAAGGGGGDTPPTSARGSGRKRSAGGASGVLLTPAAAAAAALTISNAGAAADGAGNAAEGRSNALLVAALSLVSCGRDAAGVEWDAAELAKLAAVSLPEPPEGHEVFGVSSGSFALKGVHDPMELFEVSLVLVPKGGAKHDAPLSPTGSAPPPAGAATAPGMLASPSIHATAPGGIAAALQQAAAASALRSQLTVPLPSRKLLAVGSTSGRPNSGVVTPYQSGPAGGSALAPAGAGFGSSAGVSGSGISNVNRPPPLVSVRSRSSLDRHNTAGTATTDASDAPGQSTHQVAVASREASATAGVLDPAVLKALRDAAGGSFHSASGGIGSRPGSSGLVIPSAGTAVPAVLSQRQDGEAQAWAATAGSAGAAAAAPKALQGDALLDALVAAAMSRISSSGQQPVQRTTDQ